MERRQLAMTAALCAGLLVGGWAGVASADLDEPAGVDALEVYDPLFDDEEFEGIDDDGDPFETGNRWIFDFNEGIDCRLLDPITRGYQFLVPAPARRGAAPSGGSRAVGRLLRHGSARSGEPA